MKTPSPKTAATSEPSPLSAEKVEGVWFALEPPTPFLKRETERLKGLFEATFGPQGFLVEAEPVLTVGDRSLLRPDLVLRAASDPQGAPPLALELRRESTDRFALGLKRLAYASAQVLDYWFLDHHARTLRILRLDPTKRAYEWPGEVLGPKDQARMARLPQIPLPVTELLRAAPTRA